MKITSVTTIAISFLLLSSCHHPSDLEKISELRDSIKMFQASPLLKVSSRPSVDFGGETVYLSPSKEDLKSYISQLGPSSQIDSATAANKLDAYKTWRDLSDDGYRNSSMKWDTEVYGNLYTWNEFRDFVMYVKELRQNEPVDSLKIDGIRVYAGATFYKSSFVPDVFLMPTVNTKNYIDIDPHFPKYDSVMRSDEEVLQDLKNQKVVKSDEPIFNVSRPCPFECN